MKYQEFRDRFWKFDIDRFSEDLNFDDQKAIDFAERMFQ